MNTAERLGISRQLAQYAANARYSMLPEIVRVEAARALLNWMGCALGGSREPAVQLALKTVAELGGGPQASIIGHACRTDVASAAFVNCISASVLGFDDAHLATVAHPSSPVCSALFAMSEKNTVSGEDFLAAIALGIEITCRLSNALVLPPSKLNVGFYVTGLTAPIGVALAVGKLLRLDAQQMGWALSIAASQAGGFRAIQGTMAAHFRPGHAARSGVWAALLAAQGFSGSEDALEAGKGFFDVYATGAILALAVQGLGEHHELMNNAYKSYPCGIVIHPTIDACLDLYAQMGEQGTPVRASLRVHPLALSLCGIREPATTLESLNSLYHWAAAALVRGRAGILEMQAECIADTRVARLRSQIEAVVDAGVGSEQAEAEVTLADGRTLRARVLCARGSKARPLSDRDLAAKFEEQAGLILPSEKVHSLRDLCLGAHAMQDVGRQMAHM